MKLIKLFLFILVVGFWASCGSDDEGGVFPVEITDCEMAPFTILENHREGVDYIISCDWSVNSDLTIEQGVTIQMNAGSGIRVGNGAVLTAVGNQEQPIIIEGSLSTPGYWSGIYIANLSSGIFKYCKISDAGADNGIISASCQLCSGPYTLIVENCTLSNSASCAINSYNNQYLTQNNNTYLNIAEGPICPAMRNGTFEVTQLNTGISNEGDCTKNLSSAILIHPKTIFEPCASVFFNGGMDIYLCLNGTLELKNLAIDEKDLLLYSFTFDTNFPAEGLITGSGGSENILDYSYEFLGEQILLRQKNGCGSFIALQRK